MFELPIEGARVYTAIFTESFPSVPPQVERLDSPVNEQTIAFFPQGTALTVLAECGAYWFVEDETGEKRWVQHAHCFVNLPDLLPSAIYLCPNASASVMRSCGRDIPTLTGEKLYNAYAHNSRLGRGEFRLPLLYAAAKKLAAAQSAALAVGDCIVVYEGFRPLAVQQRIVAALGALADTDAVVMDGITAAPWEIDWFIATGISKHQRGMAMDIGLAKLGEDGVYELYEMPTPIHELSRASASLAYPVTSRDDIAWRGVPDAPAMTDGARRLRGYCTGAGLTPLASEWWHFNDLQAEQLDGTEQFVLPDSVD